MNDDNKLSRPIDKSFSLTKGKLSAIQTPFQQRIASKTINVLEMPNRIALALDCSGSMSGSKMTNLKQAVNNFVDKCNAADTAIGIQTFGLDDEQTYPLTTSYMLVKITIDTLEAKGNTPLYKALTRIYEDMGITRAVLVSDGCPTDSFGEGIVEQYKQSYIPIDCVHIGDSGGGEDVLKRIAEMTGGIYIKFTNVQALSNGLSYLTPNKRALLTSGQIDASLLGAKEVK